MATEAMRRLTFTQQASRNAQYRVGGLGSGRLALEVRGLRGFEARAAEVLKNLPAILATKGVEVRFYTPLGLELNAAALMGKTAGEIDVMAAEVDKLSQAAVSRVSAIEVVRIEAGTFPVKGSYLFAGSPTTANITMSGFYAGKYPVTVAQYREFVEATNYEIAGEGANDLRALLADRSKDNHPVVFVNQADREAYAEWLRGKTGERWFILSAAQQEYIRRGISGRTYPWGDDWEEAPSYYNASRTAPVDAWPEGGTLEGVSGFGIVWEATRSYYGDYDLAIVKDPEGPSSGNIEGRGGSAWNDGQEYFDGAYRGSNVPDDRDVNVGFRLGRT
jgi:formylglycine-generating enzyme required for sulfatase activity